EIGQIFFHGCYWLRGTIETLRLTSQDDSLLRRPPNVNNSISSSNKFSVITANSERDCFFAASSPFRARFNCGGRLKRPSIALFTRRHRVTSGIGIEAAAIFPRAITEKERNNKEYSLL